MVAWVDAVGRGGHITLCERVCLQDQIRVCRFIYCRAIPSVTAYLLATTPIRVCAILATVEITAKTYRLHPLRPQADTPDWPSGVESYKMSVCGVPT